jgi:hypothetical protein
MTEGETDQVACKTHTQHCYLCRKQRMQLGVHQQVPLQPPMAVPQQWSSQPLSG